MTESKLSSCDTSSLISFRASASSSFMTTLVSFCLNKARKVENNEISTDHLTRADVRTYSDATVELVDPIDDVLPQRLARSSYRPASDRPSN